MRGVVTADLIGYTSGHWTRDAFRKAVDEIRDDLPQADIALSGGDQLQLECPGELAWRAALITYLRLGTASKAGARVAFAVTGVHDGEVPLGIRNTPAHVASGRGVVQLRGDKQVFGFFNTPEFGNDGWVGAAMASAILLARTTVLQRQSLVRAMRFVDVPHYRLAEGLGIAPSTFSQHLKAAGYVAHEWLSDRFEREVTENAIPSQ